ETVSPAPPGFPFGFSSLSDPFRPNSRWRDSPSGFRFPAFSNRTRFDFRFPVFVSGLVGGHYFTAISRQGNYALFGVAMRR
ncbi:hypothetical protein ACFOSC_25195, partial [Streptantibioticus rubrisoli]